MDSKCACGHDKGEHHLRYGVCAKCGDMCQLYKQKNACIYCGRQAFTSKHNVCYNAALGRNCDDPVTVSS